MCLFFLAVLCLCFSAFRLFLFRLLYAFSLFLYLPLFLPSLSFLVFCSEACFFLSCICDRVSIMHSRYACSESPPSVPHLSTWVWIAYVELEYLLRLQFLGDVVFGYVAHHSRRFVYDVSGGAHSLLDGELIGVTHCEIFFVSPFCCLYCRLECCLSVVYLLSTWRLVFVGWVLASWSFFWFICGLFPVGVIFLGCLLVCVCILSCSVSCRMAMLMFFSDLVGWMCAFCLSWLVVSVFPACFLFPMSVCVFSGIFHLYLFGFWLLSFR